MISLRISEIPRATSEPHQAPTLRVAPFRPYVLQRTSRCIIAGAFVIEGVQHLWAIGPVDIILSFVFSGLRNAVRACVKNGGCGGGTR